MIVLTGATGGIGGEILGSLSKIDDVIAIYNSTEPKISLKKISNVTFEKVDISNEHEIANFILNNKKILKNICLVNMAALSMDGLLANYGLDAWEKVFKVNLTSNFVLSKLLLPAMIKDKWGRIIHISSTNSAIGAGAYSSSKAGLEGLSKALAREYARYNITSNVIKLGVFDTGMFHKLSENNHL